MISLLQFIPQSLVDSAKDNIENNKYVSLTIIFATIILYFLAILDFLQHVKLSINDFTGTPLYSTFILFSFFLVIFFCIIVSVSRASLKEFSRELALKSQDVAAMIRACKIRKISVSKKIPRTPEFYRLYIKSGWLSFIPVALIFLLMQTNSDIGVKIFGIFIISIAFSSIFSVHKKTISVLVTAYISVFFITTFLFLYAEFHSSNLLYITLISLFISLLLSHITCISLIINTESTDKQLTTILIMMISLLIYQSRTILIICISCLNLGNRECVQIMTMSTDKQVFSGSLVFHAKDRIYVRKQKDKVIFCFDSKNHYIRFSCKKVIPRNVKQEAQ